MKQLNHQIVKHIFIFLLNALLLGALSACQDDPPPLAHPVSSDSIVMNAAGSSLYTANGDANTISIVSVKSNKVKQEIVVGKEPQQLALNSKEDTLYISSRYTNSVEIVSLNKHKVIASIPVGIEPYGIVLNRQNSLLYVSNYRSSTISVLDINNNTIIHTIKVEEKPKSISLTADGSKLYVVHYLTGHISVINTRDSTVMKVIQLLPSPDKKDPKKSQGIVNEAEQFRIAPDGLTAWVSHLLTNIDTPIHFDETIFPAFSIIDLVKDEEITDSRKELFDEINIQNVLNETIIVSNPADIVFLPDGSKAYGLMSGSEDLLVFDLHRGGKASQLIHRVPGNNPLSMAISPDGEDLYIHNAMSHDLTLIKTGGSSPHAEAKLVGKTIPLIAKDPLPPLIREGKTIFYSANSDEYPITGKNWMSCLSCHAGGENNGLTMMTPKGPRNTPSNVAAMKTGLFMWDGSRDDFADYILTVQGEMGGMQGEDASLPLNKKSAEILGALQAYLEFPGAFPVPESPYLKMDGTLTASAEMGKAVFQRAGCISCHAGDYYTDSSKATDHEGKLSTSVTSFLYDVGTVNTHDLASAGDARANHSNPRTGNLFDVPTLVGIWATAPYLHDGSAATLHDVLVKKNQENKHGTTTGLTEEEIGQLVDYLNSLK